ncbi:biotin/lipoyl-binding protein [Cellulomonas sp. NPDC058312]|uniref:HlyD family efflux transporter periplasmic adaptor subunit n=1 Tax=Cellulomonas sp. NPDC058312 TaxID=3346441 RepID=UPI0036EEB7B7
MRDALRRGRRSPAATAGKAPARRRVRRRRLVVGGVATALVLVLVGGGVALAVGGSTDAGYRTATAAPGTVAQTIDATGTVASASRSDRAFSVAGTVAAVDVAVGDTVTAGQVLATLDTTALAEAVDEAEQAVADAQQQLEDDIDSQTATSTSSSASAGTSTGTATPSGASAGTGSTTASGTAVPGGSSTPDPTADPAVDEAVAAVTSAQQALLTQYAAAQEALATGSAASSAATAACQALLDLTADGTSTETTTEPTDPATDPTADPTDGATDGAGSTTAADLVACQDAIAAVQTAQAAVDAAQASLMTLVTELDSAVTAARQALTGASSPAATTPTTPSTTTPSTTTPTTTTPATTAPTTSTGTASAPAASTTSATGVAGAGTTVASAADLLADQAAIDQAQAQLAVAQSRLGLVDLTSPIAGTVAAVSIAAGDDVEAQSTSAVITVIGADGYTVSTTVPLAQVDLVEVGQEVAVQVGSSDEDLTGTVTGIGVLNASTTSADPSYTVDIALDPAAVSLFDGSSAQVSIAVAAADETLTVPSSAVHLDGTTATVQVLRDGAVTDVEVQRGAVGSERTEIVSGLDEGDEVVLADLSVAMVAEDDGSSAGLTGLGGSADDTADRVGGGMVPPGGAGGFGGQVPGAPPGS